MADNKYVGGIQINTSGFEVKASAPVDSRFRVKNAEGLNEILNYEGLISYVENEKKYYQYVDGAWKPLAVNSLDELKALIAAETTAAMEFKGGADALPTNPTKGDFYKVTGVFEVNGENVKVGDSIVYNGEAWTIIPSGDDIEDTWRIIQVNGVSLGGIADGKTLNLVAGDNVTLTNEDGKVTIASTYEDTHYESKLVVGNGNADVADEAVAENGNVHLNLIEDGVVKSSHKIVGMGGITVTHEIDDTDGNVITIEAPEGAKYDLAAKTENNEVVLSLAGTDNTEDKVAIVGAGDAKVTLKDGKVTVGVEDKYSKVIGIDGDNVTLGAGSAGGVHIDGYTVTLGVTPADDPYDSSIELNGTTTTKGTVRFEADPNGTNDKVEIKIPAYYNGKEIATKDDIPANKYENYIEVGELTDGEDNIRLTASQGIELVGDHVDFEVEDVYLPAVDNVHFEGGKHAKVQQTAVANKITDKAHVITGLTQNANGEIDYDVKKLTPDDIGAAPADNYLLADGSNVDAEFELAAHKITLDGEIVEIDGHITFNGVVIGALATKDKVAEADIDGTIGVGKINGLGALATEDNITHDLVTDFDNAVKAVKVDAAIDADKLGGVEANKYALTENLGDLATKNDITAALVTDFATEVAKIKVTNATNADNADTATEADHAINADNADHATNADNAADAAKLGGVEAAKYALKKDIEDLDSTIAATEGSVLTGVTITDGKLTAKTEVALHDIATTGSIYDVAEGANANTGADKATHPEYLIFNCGTATTII